MADAEAATGAATDEKPDAETAVGTDTVLPVADSASDADSDADPDADESKADAGTGDGEAEVEAAESDVVAEAEAVARKAAEADAAAKAAAAADAPEAATETPDNLRIIEGIGPKIASALVAAGYPTYAKIAAATEDELREAVAGQGIKFAPSASSWADQAQYLVDSDADGLEEYQDYLVGGQERRAQFNEKVDYADVDEIAGADAKAEALAEDEAEAAAAEATPEPEPEPQDLQRIEGIGPKIEAALKSAGYPTYAKVAAASETELREALTSAGITFAPAATSWADQAQYLVDGDEDGLREYQDYLIGGQDRASKFKENVDYADVDEIAGADAKAEALAEDEAEAAAAEATPEPEPQDLQRIEGIGPKIETTLKSAGYTTYAKVAAASETELREALATGGITFAPAATSWAEQAQFLAEGDEDGLQEFQDYLIGGQDRRSKFSENVDYTDVDEIADADAKAAALAADEAKAAAGSDAEPDTKSDTESDTEVDGVRGQGMNLRTVLPPVIVGVLGLGVLSGVQDTGFRERIESELTERAQSALSAAGLDEVEVELTGRDADVTAPTDADALAASDVLGDVDGIRATVAYGPDGPASGTGGAVEDESLPEADASPSPSADDASSPEATDPPSDGETADGETAEPEDEEPEREPTREEREQAQEDLVEIPNITFVTDSARLTKDGRAVVREAAEVLEEHPEVEVRIEGHTDSVGTRSDNQQLSERRAEEVVDRLVELGVDRDRLTSKGFGESNPLVVPRTFADLEKNRRVEFDVVS